VSCLPNLLPARLGRDLLRDDHAAQLVEFAVALPLLVVFVVGIFDFSNAFTLKLRLTNVAREAVRAAASGPSSDVQVGGTAPISVVDAINVIDYYLQNNNINDCGLSSTLGGGSSSSGLTWTFTSDTNGCPPPGLTVTINRGYSFPATSTSVATATCTSQPTPSGQTAVIATCISVQYPYPWRFGKVASLLGSNNVLPAQFTVIAVALNED
jgi:Flp pilus assembly protein TadG